ncbi:MAG: MBL fold metallo-hydrolase [Candidatus Marinimicrobia bacterium]|nr:MBL fold metallo-hydrolase [Candidatus Neomarinimicrobiota bacterium]
MSARQLCLRLTSVDIEPASVSALLISHEHGDHLRGARVFAKKFGIPVYMNRGCFENARIIYQLGELDDIRLFDTGHIFDHQDFMIHPLSISHDTSDPVCFRIDDGKRPSVSLRTSAKCPRLSGHRPGIWTP